jgi:Lon protease-like protein
VSGLLPLFPLSIVALPGNLIPLHIFEERYKTMVGECERNGSEFGIVLAKDGGIVNVGCTVSVETVLERFPDGRFDVLTRGQRRFEILSIDQELDWLRGEVEFFDDDDMSAVNTQLRVKALASWREIGAALASDTEIDPDDPLLSFQLAQRVNDLEFQNQILRSRSESERLRKFVEFADGYVSRAQYAEKMRRAAPTNGSGHKPANL